MAGKNNVMAKLDGVFWQLFGRHSSEVNTAQRATETRNVTAGNKMPPKDP